MGSWNTRIVIPGYKLRFNVYQHPLMSHQTWHIGHWCPIICIKFTFPQKTTLFVYNSLSQKKNQHYLYKLYKIHFPPKKSTLHKHLWVFLYKKLQSITQLYLHYYISHPEVHTKKNIDSSSLRTPSWWFQAI